MAENHKPNVVVIMTDQQRADVSAREKFPLQTTPSLDNLASKGAWFRHAYTSTPVCAPARESFLTGRFPSAHRVRENRGLRHATYEQDLFGVLKAEGYRTAMIGKNHSHLKADAVDEWFEFTHDGGRNPQSELEAEFDAWMRALNHAVSTKPTPFPLECQAPYRMVTHSESWIDSSSDSPFFLWLSFAEPHNPYQVPEPYYSMFPPEEIPPVTVGKEALANKGFAWQFTRDLGEHVYPEYDQLLPRYRANYLGMLRLIDDQIHRFLEHLERAGQLDNTIIVFLSDHGDFVGEYGLMRKGPDLPEVLTRVPMQFTGPGIVAREMPLDAHVSMVDILPTLCEAVGAPLPAGVQGRSLWPLLTGEDYPESEFRSIYAEHGYGGLRYMEEDGADFNHCLIPGPKGPSFDELNTYSQSGIMRMVKKGNWKLTMDAEGHGQLYDLSTDPFELQNLFGRGEHADIQQDLMQEMVLWLLRVQDPLPYPVDKYIPKFPPKNYWGSDKK